MRFYEILNEQLLLEFPTHDMLYKGFTIKYTPEATFNKDGKKLFGAVGLDQKGNMVGPNSKPHLSDTQDGAIAIVKNIIDDDFILRKNQFAGKQNIGATTYNLNFNTKFTDNIMINLEKTWVKLIIYNGEAALEIVPEADVAIYTDEDLRNDGYKKLRDRMGFGKPYRAYQTTVSNSQMKQFELEPRGRYILELSGDPGRQIYTMNLHSIADDKSDKLELSSPGLQIATTERDDQPS